MRSLRGCAQLDPVAVRSSNAVYWSTPYRFAYALIVMFAPETIHACAESRCRRGWTRNLRVDLALDLC